MNFSPFPPGWGSDLVVGYKWLLLAERHLGGADGDEELRPRVKTMMRQV